MSLIFQTDCIAVFGARGMAGSAVCRALSRNGFNSLIKPTRDDLDLLNGSKVGEWMLAKKPDVVVLAAAKVGGIHANNAYPADFLLENLKIQTHVIESAWRSGVKKLLFLGSSCIYPKYAKQPIKEEELLTGSLEPSNKWYAIAKIAGVKLCESLRLQYGFDAISLMPTNLYGPGDNYHLENSHVLAAMIRRFYEASLTGTSEVTCWGSGSPFREFLHVEDLGEACVFALKNWSALSADAPKDKWGEVLAFLNVGTGVDCSIKHLAEQVAAVSGFVGKIKWDKNKPDGTPRKQLDVSRLTSLGWSAQIPLNEGLLLAFEDFKKTKEAQLIRQRQRFLLR